MFISLKKKILAQRFVCHICGRHSNTPGRKIVGEKFNPGIGWDHQTGTWESEYGDDWSVPGDMILCSVCKKWTCFDHCIDSVCSDHKKEQENKKSELKFRESIRKSQLF